MVETARVQYVFLDVVGFTKNRSVEAQSDIIAGLNDLMILAVQSVDLPLDSIVFLPTGDGMAVAMIDVPAVDVHLRWALEVLRRTAHRNSHTEDASRRFEVRIGINENIDNVLLDINQRRNVAGAGVSMAQRIMDKADAGQILVGQAVYDVLRQREKYLSSFRVFHASGKHDVAFPVYQYLSKDSPGLNVATPSAFAAKGIEPAKLTKQVAYYIAHAAQNRPFLRLRKADPARDDAATVLLAFLSEDSLKASETPVHEEATPKTWRAGSASFEEQYQHYYEIDFWPLVDLAKLLQEKYLQRYSQHFEAANYFTS
jgi:class 3 adenylate cyclase